MAAGATTIFKIYEEDSLKFGANPDVGAYLQKGINFKILYWKFVATASNGKAEISIPTNVLDGTVTPVLIHVLSDDVADKDDVAGAVRIVRVVGICETSAGSGVYEVGFEDIAMISGSGATSTKLFKRLDHAYAISWGSAGSDAEGTITVQNVAEDTIYLTIATGKNNSDGFEIFLPENWAIVFLDIRLKLISVLANFQGVKITLDSINLDGEGADPDFPEEFIATHRIDPDIHVKLLELIKQADAGARITFSEEYVGAAHDFDLSMTALVFNTVTGTY